MKPVALLVLANLFIINLLAQQTPDELMQKCRRAYPNPCPSAVTAQRGTRIAASVLADPKQLAGFLQRQTIAPVTQRQIAKTGSIQSKPVTLSGSCNNNSLFQTVGFTHNVIGVSAVCSTQDNNVLIAGVIWDSTAAHPGWQINGFLLRCDMNGNILWVSLFEDPAGDAAYYFNPILIKEESDGSLVMASYFNNTQTTEQPITTIYHLTSTGAIIWHKELKSVLEQYMNEWTYFSVKDINPGLNGDYIISGTTIGVNNGAQGETVVRLDANGNYIWDINLTNKTGDYDLGAEGMTAYLNGSNIVAIGLSHGSSLGYQSLETATIFTTLDYATGTVQNERYFIYPFTNIVQSYNDLTYYNNYATRLNNGHYLVYGALIGSASMGSDTTAFFGVQEFDVNFNPVNSYCLSSLVHSSEVSNIIFFDNNANGFIGILQGVNVSTTNIYFSSVRNDQIARQRVVTYGNGIETGSYTHGCFLSDGSYFVADSYYDPASGAYLSMKKMYDTDTSSVCLGRDTLFVFEGAYPIQEDPGYMYLDAPSANQITTVSYPISQGTIAYYTDNPCQRNSYCTLLSIQGPITSCGVTQPQLYKATRNPECGATPQWQIDTAVVSSITPVNDTTVSIQFKNVNWQGKIYAQIPVGSCVALTAADSLALSVISAPAAPDLAPDTILCTGNSIILHAGPIYASYLWQDGSTDSNYTVTNTGTYSVAVTDACGNNYTSTSVVMPGNFPFSLGPDITKCNRDTVILKATEGFINYQWTSTAPIQSGIADSVVTVDPVANATYSVMAEKWPGCTVNSSVKVYVFTSLAIDLGDDTSFCYGGSVMLDAGQGFVDYLWSTGAVSEQIAASQAGVYTIAAGASNGCISRDTFVVNAVYPLPAFSLGGPDTTICSNQPIYYAFGVTGDQYLWSDGLASPQRMIDQAGTYGLTVTSPEGCSMSHMITVSVNQAPTINLGDDTTLCNGSTLVLNAGDGHPNESYYWQDGSTNQDYTVTDPGLYFVTATSSGCSSGDTIAVAYIGVPEFTLGGDTVLCPGQTFTLQPSITYTGDYQWQDGSTQNYFVVQDTGTYALSVSNVCGANKASVKVQPGLCRLAMPSAFTPNGDGRNDVFRVKYPFTASKFKMMVFDRWGTEVFATENMDNGWDGTFRGTPEPTGTYVWYISLIDDRGILDTAKGTVILIR